MVPGGGLLGPRDHAMLFETKNRVCRNQGHIVVGTYAEKKGRGEMTRGSCETVVTTFLQWNRDSSELRVFSGNKNSEIALAKN